MIRRILINNSPAFKLLELELFSGFNVFSGASGAGKSVFMESLLAIFGIKDSNADLIETNIETKNLDQNALEDFGIIDDDELVLSILKKEKVRYFLNHQSSSKRRLSELVSGFTKHISAKADDDLKSKNVLRILDEFVAAKVSAHAQILTELSEKFSALKDLDSEISELEAQEKNIENLKEFAKFEISKIRAVNPKNGEYEQLLELKKTLSKQEKILNQTAAVRNALENLACVDNFLNLVDEPCEIFYDGLSALERIVEQNEEKLQELQNLNPEEMLNRISDLSELLRKYGSVEAALERAKQQEENLQKYENLSFNKKDLLKKREALSAYLQELVQKISAARFENLNDFQNALSQICAEVLLKNVAVHLEPKQLDGSGKETCAIFLGESEANSLSSGEYNRMRLALLCVEVGVSKRAGILVLDEIDANLSGQESEGVAKILKRLASSYQIFAISHQPHMPALADHHFLVFKDGDEKSGVKLLDFEGRVSEIARMISGSEITPQALDFARNLLSKKA